MLHTKEDKTSVEFLSDKIKEEKEIQEHKLSEGWELKVNRTEAKLVWNVVGEKITVTVNNNSGIPPTFDGEKEPSQEQNSEEREAELTSTPNFTVEVRKDNGKKALVQGCHHPEDEVGQEEDENDIFSIREVSFQCTGQSEWKDTNYTLRADSLEWPSVTTSWISLQTEG